MTSAEAESADTLPLAYRIDVMDRSDDLFRVVLRVDDLLEDNAVFQFAATAPGTYQVMDIGRYVRSFEARDAEGLGIETVKLSTNQWKITDPERVAEIAYTIAETWDTPVSENRVLEMGGTSIEQDHVLINTHAVIGFPTGMQRRPIALEINYPRDWTVGTALPADDRGIYQAHDYDHLVDSPILLGVLSHADMTIRDTTIDIYTYSKSGKVKSEDIQQAVSSILFAADSFLVGLPVDRYTFLFHFEDFTAGAWEHSYSSEYIYAEDSFEAAIQPDTEFSIPDVVAHEFFHVVTPLNIHSEIIAHFNFVEPVPSMHLWFYEGVTEWSSNKMQLFAGLMSPEDFLKEMSTSLLWNDRLDPHYSYSLTELSLTSYSPDGQRHYYNIYQRGAATAALLDIRLLELTDGAIGLRDLVIRLAEMYGTSRPFSEDHFFDTIAELTHPDIRDFFHRYVEGKEPLPVADYFERIGVHYQEDSPTGEIETVSGVHIGIAPDRVLVVGNDGAPTDCSVQPGDELLAYNDTELSVENVHAVLPEWVALSADVPYTFTVRREGETIDVTCVKYQDEVTERHVFTMDEDATSEQLALRAAWIGHSDAPSAAESSSGTPDAGD
jgi:predicted metalloprotease with PDZ domain